MSNPFTLKDTQEGKIQFTSDCKVMQFTGLFDKNGKEIYEGDIVQNIVDWEVKFNRGCFCADRINPEGLTYDTLLALRAIKDIVIIGNIYQNPEKTHPSSKRG